MIKTDLPKGVIRSLSEEDQDAVAAVALSQLKTRARLEKLAGGSVWVKLGWVLPIAVSVVILGMGSDLSGYLPVIIIFILLLIQGEAAHVHARMDAIYRIMMEDKESLAARITQAEDEQGGDRPSK